MKKLVSILLVLVLSLSLLTVASAEAPKKVGVAMPTMDLQRWICWAIAKHSPPTNFTAMNSSRPTTAPPAMWAPTSVASHTS